MAKSRKTGYLEESAGKSRAGLSRSQYLVEDLDESKLIYNPKFFALVEACKNLGGYRSCSVCPNLAGEVA